MDAKLYRFGLLLIVLSFIQSCSDDKDTSNVIKTIRVESCQVNEFTWESCWCQDSQVVDLQDTSKKFSFTEISKLICKNDKIYILDWRMRRIISFDMSGKPLGVLNKRGRSNAEYLQISDFDVDPTGDFWILDGQRDAVIHYSKDGKFCDLHKLDGKQCSYLSYNTGRLLLGISRWDKSDNKVIVVDTNLTVISKYGVMPKKYDADFSFPCVGFSLVNNTFQYNNPIDDNVSVMNGNEYVGEYHFDFGSKSVPDEIRADIEPHRKNLAGYSFLTNVIGVFDNFVVGTLHEGSGYVDFILDMKSEKIFKQPLTPNSYHLTAICGDKVFLSGYDMNAEKIRIAYIPADSILKSIEK